MIFILFILGILCFQHANTYLPSCFISKYPPLHFYIGEGGGARVPVCITRGGRKTASIMLHFPINEDILIIHININYNEVLNIYYTNL